MRPASFLRPPTAMPTARFVLPVSGIVVGLLHPTGAEDLLLADAQLADPVLAWALAERLGQTAAEIDWSGLTVTDIDSMILRLRQMVLGNQISANVHCQAAGCASRVEISFAIDAYLEHHLPRNKPKLGQGWSLALSNETPGWYQLLGRHDDQAQFRLPTLADQIAVAGLPNPALALAERCISDAGLNKRMQARVEMAMAELAPPLSGLMQGQCPDCRTPITVRFEARLFCLQELRNRARFVYDDVDTLALRYHWSEQEILNLTYVRRAAYAERARQVRQG